MQNEGKSYFVAWEWRDKYGQIKAAGNSIIDTKWGLKSSDREDLMNIITKNAGSIDGCTLQIKTINLL